MGCSTSRVTGGVLFRRSVDTEVGCFPLFSALCRFLLSSAGRGGFIPQERLVCVDEESPSRGGIVGGFVTSHPTATREPQRSGLCLSKQATRRSTMGGGEARSGSSLIVQSAREVRGEWEIAPDTYILTSHAS